MLSHSWYHVCLIPASRRQWHLYIHPSPTHAQTVKGGHTHGKAVLQTGKNMMHFIWSTATVIFLSPPSGPWIFYNMKNNPPTFELSQEKRDPIKYIHFLNIHMLFSVAAISRLLENKEYISKPVTKMLVASKD